MILAERKLISPYYSAKLFCGATFILYSFIAAIAMIRHEPWGDEVHSWNIAKGSGSFLELIANTRYEGHPPLWYSILWAISKFSHDFTYVQTVHLIIAISSVFIIIFLSPFSLTTRLLMPFGYYFLFEYAVISRNYAVGVFLGLCLCVVIRKSSRFKTALYYLLLFLMTNSHLLAILLGASLHLYFLMIHWEQKKNIWVTILHGFLGLIVALPALYFIFPPSDSQLNATFWINRWSYHNVTAFIQAPLFAFIPIPAWWHYNSWNTQFLIEAKTALNIFKVINLLVAIAILLLVTSIFRRNKKALSVFSGNLLLSFIVAVAIFPMTAERYAGFLFIGFIVAYWLYASETILSQRNNQLVNGLLIIQLLGCVFIVPKDLSQPFSNAYRVNELLDEVPARERIVTDYWAMNTISTFTDKAFYCIDLQKSISFIQWNSDLGRMHSRQHRYAEGVNTYFRANGVNQVYMISTGSPSILLKVDSQLFKSYQVSLFDRREGAIEKGGNLYLYKIASYAK